MYLRKLGWIGLTLICFGQTLGQSSVRNGKLAQKLKEGLVQNAIESISYKPESDTVFQVKSEEVFKPFEGKIIRKIEIEHYGFERSVQDTTRKFRSAIIKTANALHIDSRDWLIRNNLFLKEGKPVNPYRLADNERYLRDLPFILDSRIFVMTIPGTEDSVDLRIVTRDVFSLGASIDPSDLSKYRFRVQDANFLGMGQRLQYTGEYDFDRSPRYAYETFYEKNNLFGSFINVSMGYTQRNTGVSLGNENEKAYYLRLNRPLFMPFARWAGGAELSRNFAQNVYSKPDSLFARYHYKLQDIWAGYSFGSFHLSDHIGENRNRQFFSVRLFNQEFQTAPNISLSETDRVLYSNRTMALAQLTFFRQDFYKTKFIYGFGRTEDVPYGYNISFTTGWEKQAGLERPYFGFLARKTLIDRSGRYFSLEAVIGSYYSGNRAEDGLASFTFSGFSKLYPIGRWQVRHFGEMNYSRIFNREIKNPLSIDNGNGIPGFVTDSLRGDAKARARYQSVIYPPWKLLGFHFALTPQVDVAWINLMEKSVVSKKFFQAYSLGIRTRNENLIFNTVELRGFYYPKTVEGIENFRITLSTNLRIKYPTALVSAPSTAFN